MNKNFISKLTLTTVSIASVFSAIAIEPAQAANIKEWQIDFFDDAGELVGEGSFSYDLDTETFVRENFFTDDGFYVQTGLDDFFVTIEGINWGLSSASGTLWWIPETRSTQATSEHPRYGVFQNDFWFFGDVVDNEDFLSIGGTEGSGTWSQAFDYSNYSSGTWTATPIPEPASLFGLIAVFGFGVLFPQKRR